MLNLSELLSMLLFYAFLTTVRPNNTRTWTSSLTRFSCLSAARPDLLNSKKIIYFHENQFEYPNREEKERDGQFGWSQFVSCLAADAILWNSTYNMESFFAGLKKFLSSSPKDQRPDVSMIDSIARKSQVFYFPLFAPPPPSIDLLSLEINTNRPLHILWNHRWEWDKGPDVFFSIISELALADLKCNDASTQTSSLEIKMKKPRFVISVIGESFGDVPSVFEEFKNTFGFLIQHWGFVESKEEYFNVLYQSDIVISTAFHEFFGVSVLEAAWCGAFPLVPTRLVFPEIFPKHHLYNTNQQLAKKLRYWIKYPGKLRRMEWKKELQIERFSSASFEAKMRSLLEQLYWLLHVIVHESRRMSTTCMTHRIPRGSAKGPKRMSTRQETNRKWATTEREEGENWGLSL